MVLTSLREAIGLLARKPTLWIAGIIMGLVTGASMLAEAYGGVFYTQPLMLFQFLLLPLLVGGVYGMIKTGAFSASVFLKEGMQHYFRILLPSLVITFAALLTVLLLAIPLLIMGLSAEAGGILGLTMVGVLVSFAFFTFFYDIAAVYEDRKVFDSIRRSVEIVIQHSGKVLLFFIVNVLVLFGIGFIALVAWTAIFADSFEPLTRMNSTELEGLMPQDIFDMIGMEGLWVTAVLYALIIMVITSVLYAYKACFFRRIAGETGAVETPQIQGEYDEKGRWYKY